MQLKLKLDNLNEAMKTKIACNIKMTARVCMHMSGVNKTYKIRSDL